MESENEAKVSPEQLYKRFLSGDKEAFEKLVALYEHELYSFINSIVNDYYEAKHLMIEAFAILALKSGQFEERSSLKTYLFTIGKNLAFKYIKKRVREQHISYEEIMDLIDDGETPEQFIERNEFKRDIKKAMQMLNEDYRVVLVLLYFEDMSYEEAGRVMKKNVKQISNLAYRAKASLKQKLEQTGFSR